MKRLLKALFIWVLLTSQTTKDKNIDVISLNGKNYQLDDILTNLKKSTDKEYQIQIFEALSAQGKENPKAMNILALAYYSGLGVEKDLHQSKSLFEISAQLGSSEASYNLAAMYRRGIGVRQDYNAAFSYLEQSMALGNSDPTALYDIGYFYFKGLGGNQNYEKAVSYLMKSAESSYPPSMHLLGFCYKYGYGVEKNTAKSNYWLHRANKTGWEFSQSDIIFGKFDKPAKPNMLACFSLREDEFDFNRAKALEHKPISDQEWSGYWGRLVTYDWSREYIVSEIDLNLSMKIINNQCIIDLESHLGSNMQIHGLKSDNQLIFTPESNLPCSDYMNVSGILHAGHIDNPELLRGELQFYSSQNMEPERPIYLIISPKKENVYIYFNPDEKFIDISFAEYNDQSIYVKIYSQDEKLLYNQKLTKINSRERLFRIKYDILSGNYLLRIVNEKDKAVYACSLAIDL